MPEYVVVDSNVVIALAAKEADKYAAAEAALDGYIDSGAGLVGPGVLLAECLYILCKKAEDRSLSSEEYADAVAELAAILGILDTLPIDETMLAERAAAIRGQFGCSRALDAIFVAVAEALAKSDSVHLVTFDVTLAKQIPTIAPAVAVNLLIPTTP